MVDKMEHTPLPWGIDPDGHGTPWNIETANGDTPIALAAQVVGDDTKQSTRSANALFIVRACNSHDELLEGLASIAKDLEELASYHLPAGHPDYDLAMESVKTARAVIAKAGSE